MGTLKRRIRDENFNTEILDINRKNKKSIISKLKKIPNSQIFVENSPVARSVVRKRILNENLIQYVCSLCSNNGSHLGLPLVLQLDHINGKNSDHRLENLRWLCPNCHSQTSTFSGKKQNTLCKCGRIKKTRSSLSCKHCQMLYRKQATKIIWPDKYELYKMVWSKPLSKLSHDLHVSDNAIRKKCKSLGITLPEQGYWLRNGRVGG
jgi:Zn finger protein HypA/HybF involved in hydrogenase expression